MPVPRFVDLSHAEAGNPRVSTLTYQSENEEVKVKSETRKLDVKLLGRDFNKKTAPKYGFKYENNSSGE